MPLYMYQAAYTAESLAAQLKKPENRVEAVGRAACEKLNRFADTFSTDPNRAEKARAFAETFVVAAFRRPLTDEEKTRYARTPFEGIVDLETAAKRVVLFALAIAAGGAVKSAKTTVLMTGAEAVAGMKKADAVAKVYKPAR